ncbi:hypothetical protein [Cryptosporidium parvum Iowa II]|uniref:Uncharacterized protein n=2 Tax=Cryptosporidium parvum TaxID=5807 RepID=Q5CWI2_CRYPI|nr:hypothetical protein [Cryptosporidium parvum Iowa II]QOY41387.1 Uncharacterized protein CPATCC_0016630 [Cryptosporidium parvum]WKS78615.1 hypothetical protein CPCDC_6g4980 [Cryptosporidium sp. 43IA8]EAK90075.1 hypothetical protein cgd6_4980 [Cryptosporidium parvum Iowa II]WRK33107.1 Uncharacterized protein cpbgf_6004980 [Cryptosporidium parvum]CAD98316.1 hypothetical predicted multi-pass transmembrane protein, unknown function [Cryptosporidium parvum]|eukprot:QOY41387.1 hypothetical protein CPATCC_003088 [Cryptosporidium parvum]
MTNFILINHLILSHFIIYNLFVPLVYFQIFKNMLLFLSIQPIVVNMDVFTLLFIFKFDVCYLENSYMNSSNLKYYSLSLSSTKYSHNYCIAAEIAYYLHVSACNDIFPHAVIFTGNVTNVCMMLEFW